MAQQDTATPDASADSIEPVRSSGGLAAQADLRAADSVVMAPNGQMAYAYNLAVLTYQDIKLEAGYIEMDQSKDVVFASGFIDSTGQLVQRPIFTEAGKVYHTDTIRYNFRTKKAQIKKVITQEGDGFLHGRKVKKVDEQVLYIRQASFTTCSHEHPHFRIQTNRSKIISGEKIVTGPAYLEVADVPTPLVLPFGFFPTQTRRASGILIPAYGNNLEQGYFLRDGGFYWAISDYLDATFKGRIFSFGGWGLDVASNYSKRYRFNGNFSVSYNRIKIGKPNFEPYGNFQDSRDFRFTWSHAQDPKARPDLRFNANVNLASSTYFRNTQQQAQNFLNNNLQSNVSVVKTWPGRPYSLSLNLRHNQNNQTKRIDFTLPEMSFNVNRFFPFKNSNSVGTPRWYEQIGMNYTLNAQNKVEASTEEVVFSGDNLFLNSRHGARHAVGISTNFKLLKYFTLSPSASGTLRWYSSQLERTWNEDSNRVETDTVRGFYQAFDYSAQANLSTKVYGQWNYKGKVRALRHVMTPQVGFGYTPDFSGSGWGYYQTYQKDSLGNTETRSRYDGYLYGSPGNQLQGNVNFRLENTLEMKVKSKSDSTGLKKVKLLEGLSMNTSYNVAAKEFNWQPLSLTARTSMFNNLLNFNYNATYDFYGIDSSGTRVNASAYDMNGKLLRFTRSNFTVGIQLKGSSKTSGKQQEDEADDSDQPTSGAPAITEGDVNWYNRYDYVDFNAPWTLNMNYNLTMSRPSFTTTTTQSMDVSGDVKLTENWKVGFRTGYDFEEKGLTYTTFDIYRDLHCWEIRVTWVPFGYQQSYTFGLSVKAPVLRDLKLERRRGIGDF